MISGVRRRITRFAFHLLYNQLAFSYDLVSSMVSLGQWRQWQRTVLQFLDPLDADLVLELAHGTGGLQLDLLQNAYRTVALDRSSAMSRLAKRKLTKNGYRADFVRGSALSLPFTADAFPAIVCTFPTAFILHRQTLGEMHRVLRDKGCAVVVLSGYLTGGGFLRSAIKCLYVLTAQTYGEAIPASLRDRFYAAGFEVELPEVEFADSTVQLVLLRKRQIPS